MATFENKTETTTPRLLMQLIGYNSNPFIDHKLRQANQYDSQLTRGKIVHLVGKVALAVGVGLGVEELDALVGLGGLGLGGGSDLVLVGEEAHGEGLAVGCKKRREIEIGIPHKSIVP